MDANYDNVIRKIEEKQSDDLTYWNCKNSSSRKHLHSLIEYPATMVPIMQSELIEIIAQELNAKTVIDPFMGSGTVLVEGIKNGMEVCGIDINPLAFLISKVKTTPLDINVLYEEIQKINRLMESTDNQDFEIIQFDKIDKWFREDIINKLSKIRHCISLLERSAYKDFIWLGFARLVKEVCNSRKSTFKLHIKTDEKIREITDDVEGLFKDVLDKMYNSMSEWDEIVLSEEINCDGKTRLFLGDVNEILENRDAIRGESFDFICTSPPYGDNKTTVTYGEYSVLQLKWLDLDDLGIEINKDYLEVFSRIDSDSLGGKKTISDESKLEIINKSSSLSIVYNDIKRKNNVKNKAEKVVSFYFDFYRSLEKHYLLLKNDGCAMYTVGDRTVGGTSIAFNKILVELAEDIGFTFVYEITRTVMNSRMAASIKNENVVILRK